MTSKVKVNTVETESGSTLTLGKSGDTVTLASGASQSGFGRTGTVDWQTTKKTASFTAVSGEGYFVDTSSSDITVTLPASPSAGSIVSIADYTNTFATNNVTVARNSEKIGGIASNALLSTDGLSVTFVYVDSTEGWKNVQDATSNVTGNPYIIATGGTITTDGDFKVHSFTGPGTFTVCSAAVSAPDNAVDYLVVGGGGSGAGSALGGGGAGGFRIAPAGITVSAQSYPITVGAGGAAQGTPGGCGQNQGSNSVFSTITSAGGGAGGNSPPTQSPDLSKGGSGGGIGRDAYLAGRTTANNGNSPPVSPPQGNPGGVYAYTPSSTLGSAGGGGAACAGANGSPGQQGGNGGAGSPAAPVFGTAPKSFYIANGPANGASACGQFAGGGGGGSYPTGSPAGSGGVGGGGNGGGGPTYLAVNNGTANTGGGGGGNYGSGPAGTLGSSGGSGIVLIRYRFRA